MNFLTFGITITIVGMGGAFWKTLKVVRWKAAGISAYSMAARVVQMEGRMYDDSYWLLMHAIDANTGGQIGSVLAAGIMLSVLKGLGLG